MVRALRLVGTVSTAVNLSGESSWVTVGLRSPEEATTSPVEAPTPAASGPAQMAGVATTLPVSAFTTAITFSSQTEKRRRLATSMARPEGDLHGASGQ